MEKDLLLRSSFQETWEEIFSFNFPFSHSSKKKATRPKLLLLFLIYSATMFVIFFFLISLAWNYFDEVFKQATGFFTYLVLMLMMKIRIMRK